MLPKAGHSSPTCGSVQSAQRRKGHFKPTLVAHFPIPHLEEGVLMVFGCFWWDVGLPGHPSLSSRRGGKVLEQGWEDCNAMTVMDRYGVFTRNPSSCGRSEGDVT